VLSGVALRLHLTGGIGGVRGGAHQVAWPLTQCFFGEQEVEVRDGSVRIGFEVRTRRTDKVTIIEERIFDGASDNLPKAAATP
jgi:hypothetical protein